MGINDSGQVLFFFYSSGFTYVRWGGINVPIRNPAASSAAENYAHGINDSGQIVGDYFDGTRLHGFIATPVDTDGDGLPNITDPDDDNDGIADGSDNCPLAITSDQIDTDGDNRGDACDPDDDNDGVADAEDAFPLDPAEWLDTDGDGIGNNADSDDDNDGVVDAEDAFPLDPAEWLDTDGDGIGNNADSDDDNDGFPDAIDPDPLDAAVVPEASIGVWRPSTARFLLDSNGNDTWDGTVGGDTLTASFGVSTDLPVAGDWNGDGIDDVGVWRPGTRRFLLDSNASNTWDGATGGDTLTGAFGLSTDIPVTGRW